MNKEQVSSRWQRRQGCALWRIPQDIARSICCDCRWSGGVCGASFTHGESWLKRRRGFVTSRTSYRRRWGCGKLQYANPGRLDIPGIDFVGFKNVLFPASIQVKANTRELLNDVDAARRTWCRQGNRRAIEADIKSPGRRVGLTTESKGYLDLHLLNVSRKKTLSTRWSGMSQGYHEILSVFSALGPRVFWVNGEERVGFGTTTFGRHTIFFPRNVC